MLNLVQVSAVRQVSAYVDIVVDSFKKFNDENANFKRAITLDQAFVGNGFIVLGFTDAPYETLEKLSKIEDAPFYLTDSPENVGENDYYCHVSLKDNAKMIITSLNDEETPYITTWNRSSREPNVKKRITFGSIIAANLHEIMEMDSCPIIPRSLQNLSKKIDNTMINYLASVIGDKHGGNETTTIIEKKTR